MENQQILKNNVLKKVSDVGLNLRPEMLDEVLDSRPEIPFFEIIADNWLSRGPHWGKLERVREFYPLSFHCVGMNIAGTDPINFNYLDQIKELKDRFRPFQISDHLCYQKHQSHCFHDLLPFPFIKEGFENCAQRIDEVQAFFKEEILVENLSYYVEFEASDFSEAEFFNKLLNRTGAKMLLDLNNIWVNEKNLKISTDQYLSDIDLKKVREIHLAGAEQFGDVYVDTHGAGIDNDVVQMLKSLPEFVGKQPIFYERDNNTIPLNALLDEISMVSYTDVI